MVYNPEDKKFIRVNFQQPQPKKLIKNKIILNPNPTRAMTTTSNHDDDIILPDLEF
jgi:hypothetical protein